MRRTLISILLSLCTAAAGVHVARSQPTPPDLAIVNARIYTVDRAFSTAEALAITGGTFTAVGTNGEIRALAGPSTRIVDLGGRTVVPGLADDHLHNAGGGPGVDLSRARTLSDLLSAIAARVAKVKPGDLIVTNSDWHEAQLREQRLPYRRDLDGVAPRNPVVVVRGGHEYILNSAALATPVRRDVPAISSLTLEPLRVKYTVPPSWRRESPPFTKTFTTAIKPYESGDYAVAIERMRDLSVLFPKRPEPLVYGGVSHLMLGHTAEAIELLNRAAPLTREAFAEDILWYLALARRAEGRTDASMELRRICAIGADHGPKACAAVREIDARARGEER